MQNKYDAMDNSRKIPRDKGNRTYIFIKMKIIKNYVGYKTVFNNHIGYPTHRKGDMQCPYSSKSPNYNKQKDYGHLMNNQIFYYL